MIRNSKGEVIVECDECGKQHTGGTLLFREVIEEIKGEGWLISKDGDTWEHTCPDCAGDQ